MPLLFNPELYDDAIRSLKTAVDKIDVKKGETDLNSTMNFIIRGRRTARA
jgi:hypothetical protein